MSATSCSSSNNTSGLSGVAAWYDQYSRHHASSLVVAVAMLGENGVGKTSLRNTFMKLSASPDFPAGIERDPIGYFPSKLIYLEQTKQHTVYTRIWDNLGEGSLPQPDCRFFRKLAGFLLVFDLNDHHTFECVVHWHQQIRRFIYCDPGDAFPKLFLVGNKCDLPRQVTPLEIQSLCTDLGGTPYFEVSCHTGHGVRECWDTIVSTVYRDLLTLSGCQQHAT
ncbi:Ras family [Pelomyxa schiedti]|nr:Ras family [Pelomyxa schiedti]